MTTDERMRNTLYWKVVSDQTITFIFNMRQWFCAASKMQVKALKNSFHMVVNKVFFYKSYRTQLRMQSVFELHLTYFFRWLWVMKIFSTRNNGCSFILDKVPTYQYHEYFIVDFICGFFTFSYLRMVENGLFLCHI